MAAGHVARRQRWMDRAARSSRLVVALGAAASACAHHVSSSDAPSSAPTADVESRWSWVEAAPCPVARFEANGVVVQDELWVMGGFLSSSLDVTPRIDIYDPSTDRWRPGPDLPGAETHV